MNRNNLFKAVQAAYELTNHEPITGRISKDEYINSVRNDLFENALVILLNDNIQLIAKDADLRLAPSIYCSARMMVEDLAILKGIEMGLINEEQMCVGSFSQAYRFNVTQLQFVESELAVPNKEETKEQLNEERKECVRQYNLLNIETKKDLYNYQSFLNQSTRSLIKQTLGKKYAEYRDICSFFVHFGLLDENTDNEILKIGSNVLDALLNDVEKIIVSYYPNINTAKYKSFKSHIEKMKQECDELRLVEFPWFYFKEFLQAFAIDRFCIKRERAICLDFKLCLMFNLQKSICKRSKSFIEFASLSEYTLGIGKDDMKKYEQVEEFCRVSSYLRLSRIISDYDSVKSLKADNKCYELYNKYFKDDKDMSYSKMLEKLLSSSVSFLSIKESNVSIIENIHKFLDENANSKVDKWLFSILFKAGNKTDHFSGGYSKYHHHVINYWARATYLNSLLIPYSLFVRNYLSGKAFKPALEARFLDDLADEILRNGGDEFFGLDSRNEHKVLQDITAGFVPSKPPKLNVLDAKKVAELMNNNKK